MVKMVRSLDRKMLRDLWQIKGQVVTVVAVIASGVATFVMSLTTLSSLDATRDAYYEQYQFAHIFAHMKRAPITLADHISEIPGIGQVQSRIVMDVTLDVHGLTEPAVGRLISIPDRQTNGLNDIYLRRGRYIDPERSGEVLVGEFFANAHNLRLGAEIVAIVNGRRQRLTVVGVALSPEYILQIKPGDLLPDEKRFGIFWMSHSQLAAAFDMEGAFNDVAVSLMRGGLEQDVIRRMDQLIEPYGGVGAFGREDQTSHRYLSDEIRQLRGMGQIAPTIFLSVAAFLLNVVVSRLISTQREQIAALKAFGYSKWEVGTHYMKLVLVIVFAGSLVGTATGGLFGYNLTQMYTRFYKFPNFEYAMDIVIVLAAIGASSFAAILGVQASVRRAVSLPPAEAMRPEPPVRYQRTILERAGLAHLLSPVTRMILRSLERRPGKSLMSIVGIALAVAVLILGSFTEDALNYLIEFQFQLQQRQDVSISFQEPISPGGARAIELLPGVMCAEFFRSVPTRIRHEHISRRVGLTGLDSSPELFRLLNDSKHAVAPPAEGVMLSSKLAEILHVKVGSRIEIDVLEGQRQTYVVTVAALIKEMGGLNAYMLRPNLHRLLQEGPQLTGAHLQVDSLNTNQLNSHLKELPRVTSVTVKSAALQGFNDTVAENLGRIRRFNILFALIIAVGVVYNGARISFAERSRELATLRVIGFTQTEVSTILLGEMAILTAVAIPWGLLIGFVLAFWVSRGLDTEVYRIPLVVNPATYASAVCVVLAASLFSGLSVVWGIRKLDLVAVLKTRE